MTWQQCQHALALRAHLFPAGLECCVACNDSLAVVEKPPKRVVLYIGSDFQQYTNPLIDRRLLFCG